MLRDHITVVRLHDGCGHLRCGVDRKPELRLFSKFNGESLHQKRGKARASAASEGMKDEKTLETIRLVRHPPDLVHSNLYLLLADGVVAPRVVVGCVLLARDQLLRVEKLPVGPSANLL